MPAQTAFANATLQANGGGTASLSGRRKRLSRRSPYRSSSTHPTSAPSVKARTAVLPARHHVGAEVTLGFEMGDANKPIVLGVLRPLDEPSCTDSTGGASEKEPVPAALERRPTLSGAREIVLRCGKARTRLTRAGKGTGPWCIRARPLFGLNRVKSASVHIN